MTIAVRHRTQSAVADANTSGIIKPSHWNDGHDISMDTGRLLGRASNNPGAAEEITPDSGHMEVVLDGSTPTLRLKDSGATPGLYTSPRITVDAKGRITLVTNGGGGGGGGLAAVVDDTAPQLGGNLDLNGFVITGLQIGTNVQAWDAQLDSLSGASANGVSLVTAANYAAMRALLDLEAGTDFYSIAAADAAFLSPAEGNAAYQPLDIDLTAIAALAPANDDIVQRKAGAWTNRTMAQLIADLAALGTTFQPLDSDLTAVAALTPSNDDIVQRKAGVWSNRTMAQLLADLVALGYINLASGAQTLTVAPTGNTTSTLASLNVQGAAVSNAAREFLVNLGMTVATGAGASGTNDDKVTLYAGISASTANAGPVWAANFLTRVEAGFNEDSHILELDMDNLSGTHFDSVASPSSFGLSISGASTSRKTGAILISENANMWNWGVLIANNCIYSGGVGAAFEDQTNSPTAFKVGAGTHTYGFDTKGGTFTHPIRLGNNSSIAWRNAADGADLAGLNINASNQLVLGSGVANVSIPGATVGFGTGIWSFASGIFTGASAAAFGPQFNITNSAGDGTAGLWQFNKTRAGAASQVNDYVLWLQQSAADSANALRECADYQVQVTAVGSGAGAVQARHLWSTANGTAVAVRMSLSSLGFLSLDSGSFGRGAPVSKTADWTVANNETHYISNRAATNTVTLPTASSWPGREIYIKTIQAQTVVSASSNVVPSTSATAGTAILPATDGAWALLVSDGTNWIIMSANPLV